LANDPETEVGVYAIIKQTSSGEKIVIEVIPVRDSEPPVQAVEETIRKIEPAPGENDGASLEIDAEGLELLPRGRFDHSADRAETGYASYRAPALGLVLALVGLKKSSSNERDSEQLHEPIQYSRRDRIRRRMQQALKQSQQLNPEAGRES
ncbi:MAG: hypothetical protein MUF23_12300, partial [Pirellula sp.]|nr:hypothetical protein [Pirellula sp.]